MGTIDWLIAALAAVLAILLALTALIGGFGVRLTAWGGSPEQFSAGEALLKRAKWWLLADLITGVLIGIAIIIKVTP